jgi:16S rRNA (uracil1498-N3)-methyltransferase
MSVIFYQPAVEEGINFLPEEESHHCARVLRKRTGDVIEVMDGKGHHYSAILTDVSPKSCSFEITGQSFRAPDPFQIHLAIAPTKNTDRIEWMVEKCVELGLHELTFISCEHSERTRLRFDRIQKKAIAAMKQSRRRYAPIVHDRLVPFTHFIDEKILPHADTLSTALAHVNEEEEYLRIQDWKHGESCVLLIGPEGDFSEDEIQTAKSAGAALVSLGENRLRTETAGLAGAYSLILQFQ